MRTIFVPVNGEKAPSYAPVYAEPVTSTSFSIERIHPDYTDASLAFGPGDVVRCRMVRLRGPREDKPRQRPVAVARAS